MKTITKAVRKAFWTAFLFTIAFIGGIPATVFGAVYQLWVLMGFGIAGIVIGFYAMPICWTKYGRVKSLMRLVFAITEEHIDTVYGLARQLSLSDKEVRNRLDECFRKNYLVGYLRDGDNVLLNEKKEMSKKVYIAECPNCGAKFTYTADSPFCPYCRSPVIPKDDE